MKKILEYVDIKRNEKREDKESRIEYKRMCRVPRTCARVLREIDMKNKNNS